jgi:hypothetical protein
MKITPNEILTNLHNTKRSQSFNTSGQKFDEILRQQISNQASQTGQTTQPPAVQPFSPLNVSMISNGDRHKNIEQVERFLDIIETYQKQLSNPSANLRDLNTLVSMMQEETINVMPILDSLPDGNALKDVINRAVVTSTVEMIKFNRGDYLEQ